MRGSGFFALVALCACEGSQGSPVEPSSQSRKIELSTGASPGGVEVADLNGDARPDLIVTNETGSVSIFLNDGRGRFHAAPRSPFAAGLHPNDVAVADFNGDKKPDLAFANHEQHALTVLLGDGRGGFPAASSMPVRSVPHPHGIAAADLDRDGRVDLMTDSWGRNELELLRGDGGGRFAEWQMVPVGQHPYQRARIADVNRDGWPDLLASNLDSNNLSVMLGGPRGFAPAPGSPFAAGDVPFGLAAADFNGDGHLDVAVLDSPSSAAESGRDGLTLLLGDGTGRFVSTEQSPLETGPHASRIASGDLNGDGHDDVAVSLPDNGSIVLFYLGAEGKLLRRQEISVGKGAKGIAIADLNGDARKDIAVTLEGASQVVVLFR